jgi:hypothetical protein
MHLIKIARAEVLDWRGVFEQKLEKIFRASAYRATDAANIFYLKQVPAGKR